MAEGPSRLTEGMLSLSWNNHSAAFTQTLATLREKEIYTDVTLACGGKFYPVHKLVLSTCSDYFLQMFERTSCKHPIIVLKDVQCREMEALLSYMYAGIVCVPQSDLAQLIMVAEALQIKGLAVPDETMCTNKRLSHTWSPTDDRISPHAKRLRQDDNGTGAPQYQRYSDGHTIIKPQTLTGIPSFTGMIPQTRGCSPTVSSVGKHIQSTIRPMYTTVRYTPYPRDVDRLHSSPRQVQQKESDLKTDKATFSQSINREGGVTSQSESQVSFTDMDREILPETLVKVEVEERDEPIQIEGSVVNHSQPSDTDCSKGQSQSSLDPTEASKAEVPKGAKEMMNVTVVKEEMDVLKENEPEQNVEGSASSFTSTGGNEQSSVSQQTQTLKSEPLDPQPVASSHQEPSDNPAADTGSNWENDEDSSHPLDLSDAQKQSTQQAGVEPDSSRVIRRLYENTVSKFPCPYCSFKTTQKNNLSKHIRMHTVDNPFTCPYCPFRAPLHVSLKEHMNTHKGVSESGR